MSKWIRKGDHVRVIAGNDKGKIGEVLSRTDVRIVVQGVNLRRKHLRRTQETQGGRIIEMEMPIHISNVCLCNKEGEPLKLFVRQKGLKGRELVYKTADKKEVVYRQLRK